MRTLCWSTVVASSLVAACSSVPDVPLDGGGDLGAPADAAAGPMAVTFRYAPAWPGVSAVSVIGGFGQSADWKPSQPFLALTSDGAGAFSGTATLAPGDYSYVFQVTGDRDAAQPASYARYAVDPARSDFTACPAASPTFDAKAPNPCSRLTVPEPPPGVSHQVRGTVLYDGHPTAGYLVQIDREEKGSHHYFVNRLDTAAGGVFDFTLAAGQYRVQVLHPTFLSTTDVARAPAALAAVRRSLSTPFVVGADAELNAVEVAYHDYAALSPVNAQVSLPAQFQWTVVSGAADARLALYGLTGSAKNVGDPWFVSPYSTATTQAFDGGFNTQQAGEAQAKPGEQYYWGTWQRAAPVDGGVEWVGQSMVVPIKLGM